MTETEQPKMIELATLLKQAREERKLGLDEVAAKLNLSESKLQAFEQDDLALDKLNNFERGYLRNYANFLEVDISVYEEQFPDGSKVSSQLQSMERFSYEMPPPVSKSKWGKRFYYLMILVVIIGLFVLFANHFTASDIDKLLQ